MPRPGPRPYECVRRAWHSERHQAIRGSIIQQIFRLAHDAHCAATKKNKEWLRKLPAVVFKAEEIMYSKANSEAEYMNTENLWDRVNDAIDTIIRRDESAESGELLPPCIEAALNLGCVPVRASRSQRHNNPRIYLTPRAQQPPEKPRSLSTPFNERHPSLMPIHNENNAKLIRPEIRSPIPLGSEPNDNRLSAPSVLPPLYDNSPHSPNTLMNLGSVYPLYYGTHFASQESQGGMQLPQCQHSNTVLVGTPVSTFIPEATEMGAFRSPFTPNNAANVSGLVTSRGPEFDLSLRLGIERYSACETERTGLSTCSSQEGSKFTELRLPQSKEFCFFPQKRAASSRWFSEDEGIEGTRGKRMALSASCEEDVQFSQCPEFLSNQYAYHAKGADL